MAYVAQEVEQSKQEATKYYELFVTEEAETPEGETVTIKKSIGNFCLQDLEIQKEAFEKQIAEIDERIEAINAINN